MSILMLETIDDDAMTVLKSAAPLIMSPTPNAHDHELPLDDVSAIVTRGQGKLDRALMDKCPELKVIARCGTGLNNLDLEAAGDKGVQVVYAPGINAAAVAEHALMLMLMAVRHGFSSGLAAKHGNWSERSSYAGDDLNGKKVCIVGRGKTGEHTAKLCESFSTNVVYCRRNDEGMAGLRAALKQHVPTSDIISLHLPLAHETEGLFNAEIFSMFKPGAILINTARGELVNSVDLLTTLDAGRLSVYAADVVEGETPACDDPLVNHPSTIITPHVAAMTKRTYREMGLFTAINVVSALTNGNPDPASLYRRDV